MKIGGASLFPLAIVAMLAALTYWLSRAVLIDDGNRNGKSRHDPDFIVENFRLRAFGPDGSLQHSAVAPKMVHFADDDSTDITTPVFTIHRQPPMQFTAQRAWLGKDGKEARLEGGVRGVRGADASRPEAIFTTNRLYLYPDEEIARSDVPVTLTQGRSVLHGTGLDVDNKQETLLLKGPIRGTIFRQGQHTAQ